MNEFCQSKLEDQVQFLKNYLEKRTNCPKFKIPNIHNKISYFISNLKKKWSSSYKMKQMVLTKYSVWLETLLGFQNYKLLSEKCRVGGPELASIQLQRKLS